MYTEAACWGMVAKSALAPPSWPPHSGGGRSLLLNEVCGADVWSVAVAMLSCTIPRQLPVACTWASTAAGSCWGPRGFARQAGLQHAAPEDGCVGNGEGVGVGGEDHSRHEPSGVSMERATGLDSRASCAQMLAGVASHEGVEVGVVEGDVLTAALMLGVADVFLWALLDAFGACSGGEGRGAVCVRTINCGYGNKVRVAWRQRALFGRADVLQDVKGSAMLCSGPAAHDGLFTNDDRRANVLCIPRRPAF